MPRFSHTVTTPAGNSARLQLVKPWDQLDEAEHADLYQLVDDCAAYLLTLPDTSCHACGARGAYPDCYPAKRAKGDKCCEGCDHTPRERTIDVD